MPFDIKSEIVWIACVHPRRSAGQRPRLRDLRPPSRGGYCAITCFPAQRVLGPSASESDLEIQSFIRHKRPISNISTMNAVSAAMMRNAPHPNQSSRQRHRHRDGDETEDDCPMDGLQRRCERDRHGLPLLRDGNRPCDAIATRICDSAGLPIGKRWRLKTMNSDAPIFSGYFSRENE